MGVLQWIRDNSGLISALSSLGTLLIWLLYLQLFYFSYRRQIRPNLLIHQGGGFDADSLCLLANLSAGTVHVAAVLVDAECGDDSCTWTPMDPRDASVDTEQPFRHMKQGPLPTGDYLTLGSFGQLLREAVRRRGGEDFAALGEEVVLTVRVVMFVGAQLVPMGAYRRFRVRLDGDKPEVRPLDLLPKELASWRQRRVARRWLVESQRLDPSALLFPPRARDDGS